MLSCASLSATVPGLLVQLDVTVQVTACMPTVVGDVPMSMSGTWYDLNNRINVYISVVYPRICQDDLRRHNCLNIVSAAKTIRL